MPDDEQPDDGAPPQEYATVEELDRAVGNTAHAATVDELRDAVDGVIEPQEHPNDPPTPEEVDAADAAEVTVRVYADLESVPGGSPQTRGEADGDAWGSEYRDAPAVRRPRVDRITAQSLSENPRIQDESLPTIDPPMSSDRPEAMASGNPVPVSVPLQNIVRDGLTGLMLPPYPESEIDGGSYDMYCHCYPCEVTRNYRRLVYAYERQEQNDDILPREAYRHARRRADRVMGAWRCNPEASRPSREGWEAEFQYLYARWARTHNQLGYPDTLPMVYHPEYSESTGLITQDVPFHATPTGYTPPVDINFASAALNSQVNSYERQVGSAQETMKMAAGELKGGRLALKGLYVQRDNAEKAVKNSDDLIAICRGMPEIIGVRYGPCLLPGGETLQRGEVEVVFLPVLFGRSTRTGMQKRLTVPVSFRITADGKVYGAGRTNYHPHLRSESICLGYMGAVRGQDRGDSVELILTTLAGVNDIGGMLKLMSAWRLGHNPRDELNHEWRWSGVRDFFNTALAKDMWPEWDGRTVQYAPRGVIGPLDRWLPGIFDISALTHTEIGQAVYLMWKDTRQLAPYLDPYFIGQLNNLTTGQCRICYNPAIRVKNRATKERACLGCVRKEGACECAANNKVISRHQVRFFPQDNTMFYPVRPLTRDSVFASQRRDFWWCVGQHEEYRGNFKYTRHFCGNGPTLSANPLDGYAWLQCGTWITSPWTFKAMQPQDMRCYNHSIGSMRGERGELNIRG